MPKLSDPKLNPIMSRLGALMRSQTELAANKVTASNPQISSGQSSPSPVITQKKSKPRKPHKRKEQDLDGDKSPKRAPVPAEQIQNTQMTVALQRLSQAATDPEFRDVYPESAQLVRRLTSNEPLDLTTANLIAYLYMQHQQAAQKDQARARAAAGNQ